MRPRPENFMPRTKQIVSPSEYVGSAGTQHAIGKGEMPKPKRLNVITRVIYQMHKEMENVDGDMGDIVAKKNPQTQQAYFEVLARLKVCTIYLKEITDLLETALAKSPLHNPKRSRRRRTGDKTVIEETIELDDAGHSIKEIAEILDVKLDSAYSYVSRARRLRKSRADDAAAAGDTP